MNDVTLQNAFPTSKAIADLDASAGAMYTSIYMPGDVTVTPIFTSMLQPVPGADVATVDLGVNCGISIAHSQLPHNEHSLNGVIWGLTRRPGKQPNGCVTAS